MKITALVENTSNNNLKPKHGLSLYIETIKHKILFDLGPDETLFVNAEKLGLDLSSVDTIIISHGHYDHGGALKRFLEINNKAIIYIQESAFEPHFTKTLFIKTNVGLDQSLKHYRQIKLLSGNYRIDEELSLFTVNTKDRYPSSMNNSLYDNYGKDSFRHEQNLIIRENKTVLIMGCGHNGVTNIINNASDLKIDYCVGGYHLFNPVTKLTVKNNLLDNISDNLKQYKDTQFYTCHCTGTKAYKYLSDKLENMHYLSCGDVLKIN